ncbi:hypothetical protein [Tabrizicola sp.]|jgi:hypothetical protein|nr:hypothetical protein [Tabrizicola sp.]MBY0349491.1 hypothetical protein [Tabrizicola sp.]MDK2774773.1 hypothetical protein [Tabrizicola sp.]
MDINADDRFIYRSSIRLRNGTRIFAWQYGLKAFRIKVSGDIDQPRLPGL